MSERLRNAAARALERVQVGDCEEAEAILAEVVNLDGSPTNARPTFWPGGPNNREKIGSIGDGTPHARMEWLWERMRGHEDLIAELTGWSPFSSSYRFEAAFADAFDKLAAERKTANDA